MNFVHTTADKLIIRDAPAGADTGKRFLRGQTARATAISADRQWQLIEAPTGIGWASSKYLVAESAVIPGTNTPRLLYTLEGEDPEFTERIENLREIARIEGIEFDTADFGGVRSEADTIKILKYRDDDYAVYVRNFKRKYPNKNPVPMKKWRPINPFGTSHHNYGVARDLKIVRYPSSFTKAIALQRLGALAPRAGLKWGGDFGDDPHFQMPITLDEARRRYEART